MMGCMSIAFTRLLISPFVKSITLSPFEISVDASKSPATAPLMAITHSTSPAASCIAFMSASMLL